MPPSSADSVFATPADHAACRALIRQGSKSFFAAALLLPPQVREGALALYAFCRLADDAVDTGARGDPIAQLRERLAAAYDGRPGGAAADRAFADVVRRYAIPRALPGALIEGFEWDASGRQYASIGELRAYAARVAGTVGAMMACLMQVRGDHAIGRACDLGVAMQLTNIARDVGEDARAGRLYLPHEWLRDSGIEPAAWLARPVFTPALAAVLERLLTEADRLYERAGAGIASLPRDCRRAILAARALYAEIGHELRRKGLDSVARRTVVPLARKAAAVSRALTGGVALAPGREPECLAETRFLVDAVLAQPGAPDSSPLPGRIDSVLRIFERLERRDRAGGQRGQCALPS